MQKRHLVSAAVAICFAVPMYAVDPAALALIHAGLAAQGGETELRALRSVQWEAHGYRNELEQSERPEGPYIVQMNDLTEVHDLAGHRYLSRQLSSLYPVARFTNTVVVSDQVAMRLASSIGAAAPPPQSAQPGTPQQVQAAQERMALSPERLLLTALYAPDVHTLPDVTLQSLPQNVVSFMLDGAPVTLYLNPYTHLPTAVDYSGPLAHTGFWSYLGDVTMRINFSFWWLARGGIHMPLQWNVEGNGLPDSMFVISKLQINEPLNESDLTIPDDVRRRYNPNSKAADLEARPLGIPGQPAQELRPGVVLIPGAWNATFIRQDDGIVILEAPISSGYSARVIAEAKKRFPDLPVKAIITTSDSWPHLAGIREYVAQGVPIYALNLNRPILERLIAGKRTITPDALEKSPRKPDFHFVSGKTVLGKGPNRLELHPIHGETSERQMMVYFPQFHLLYGSDPFQQNDDGSFFYPQTVSELMDAVAREHLGVEQFFMMHIGPTPWNVLPKVLADAAMKDTPDGKF